MMKLKSFLILGCILTFSMSYAQLTYNDVIERLKNDIGKEDVVLCGDQKNDLKIYTEVQRKLSFILSTPVKECCILIEKDSYAQLPLQKKSEVLDLLLSLPVINYNGLGSAGTKNDIVKRSSRSSFVGQKMETEAVKSGLISK